MDSKPAAVVNVVVTERVLKPIEDRLADKKKEHMINRYTTEEKNEPNTTA